MRSGKFHGVIDAADPVWLAQRVVEKVAGDGIVAPSILVHHPA